MISEKHANRTVPAGPPVSQVILSKLTEVYTELHCLTILVGDMAAELEEVKVALGMASPLKAVSTTDLDKPHRPTPYHAKHGTCTQPECQLAHRIQKRIQKRKDRERRAAKKEQADAQQ
jgi:hypothetical protein